MNRLYPRCASLVHSTYSNSPTSTGFSHRHSAIFVAANPAPHRLAFFSGKFANGHSFISSGFILLNNSTRVAGMKPLRVRAAGEYGYISGWEEVPPGVPPAEVIDSE